MALPTSAFDADLSFMVADLGSTFIWRGGSYACVMDGATVGADLQVGGISADIQLQVVTRLALFSGRIPAPPDTITISGSPYRILTAHKSPDGVGLTLNCGGRSQ